jgi:hypothetical protein
VANTTYGDARRLLIARLALPALISFTLVPVFTVNTL